MIMRAVVAFNQLRCHFATGLRELFLLAGINPTLLSPRAMLGLLHLGACFF
jgi:hypothetical protein